MPSNIPNRPRATPLAADPLTSPTGGVPASTGATGATGGGGLAQRRSFVDPADGSRWTVVERFPTGESGDVHERSLYFVGDGVFRRVRSYPPSWRDLSDAELAALSRGR